MKDSVASKYITFTDSLSGLQSLQYLELEHPLIGMVIRKCGIVFLFFCFLFLFLFFLFGGGRGVPSHIGISGNEKADSAAMFALDLFAILNIKYYYNITESRQ